MRRAAKVDTNQTAIMRALRKSGCRVLSLAAVGKGCADLLVCRADRLHMLEVKDGNRSPSRQKLTPHQIKFHEEWPVHVVKNEIEALQIIQAALNENTTKTKRLRSQHRPEAPSQISWDTKNAESV